ncbi:lymphocyte antigen 75 isoform X2 [Sarcophilus harrisii]|uniref:lymphocyte antigen 75 isoform X2 n=1 Tax=Sarcophilus harrisii TaxID=9305 RepID=UPI000C7DE323|nr:lymphocyte antigen 75 isoform X2 [Sarcophilus harrisii]
MPTRLAFLTRRHRLVCRLLFLVLCCLAEWVSSDLTDNGPFTIRHENSDKCLKTASGWVVAVDCKKTNDMQWKWVSQHRLFHVESQMCLGIDIAKPKDSLKMFSCDSNAMLWWKCDYGTLYSASQYKLTLKDGQVTANVNSSDTWKKGDSNEYLCDQPYHEIYTRDGNSYGRPCEFPFLNDNVWHHECITDEDHKGAWCATTLNYPHDQKWGICLKAEDGCEDNWEKNDQFGSCYQLNTQASLTWKEAFVSCQNQGANLVSISSADELILLKDKEGIPKMFWIGLNQLDFSKGWEWSDHTPLNFLNWNPEIPSSPTIGGSSCVIMNAESGQWHSFPCEAQFPYVCKKQLNESSRSSDVWTYLETHCDPGWLPNNGFCYLLVNESSSWDEANAECISNHSNLISMHSLADVELVVRKLHEGETKEEIWTGLKNNDTPALFKWSDGTEVTLTYWDQNQPDIPYNKTPNCVCYSGKLGHWKVQSCEKKLKYVCKKTGKTVNETKLDKDCPQEEGWERHGEACYKIYKDEVPFGTHCNLTITNRFEQEFLNSMIKKYSKGEGKSFWTGLRDEDSRGEYKWASVDGRRPVITFVNWNSLEPASPGGCVVLASGKSLGKWEVKDCRSFKALSICKKRIGPSEHEEAIPKPDDPCPSGWHSLPTGLSCHKLFHKERVARKRTWEEAERFCQALGAHLPSFNHMDEMKEFLNFLKSQVSDERWIWVGLNKRSPDFQGSWQWSDSTPVSTVVISNEFQEDYDIRDCAAFKVSQMQWRRRWHLYENRDLIIYLKPFACDIKLEWACQIPKGHTPKTPEWFNPDRAGIHGPPVVIEGSEYWFVPDTHLNFDEAVLYCKSNQSSLASLKSLTALNAIRYKMVNLSNDQQKWWIKTLDNLGSYHDMRFHTWPRFSMVYEKECWYISSKNWFKDLYKPADCRLKLPFICEKNNVSSLEKYTPQSASKVSCSGEWISFKDKCFLKLKPKLFTFFKAKEACHTYGGSLPSILSQSEQDFITYLLPELGDDVWIGLFRSTTTKISQWTDNNKLLYSNFHPLLQGREQKIPLDFFDDDANNHCAVMLNLQNSSLTGTWNLTSCKEEHNLSLCQKYSEIQDNHTLPNTSGIIKYQDYSYKIILKAMTWYEALKECQKEGMKLVSITNPYQQAFLTVQTVLNNVSLWIGLSSQDDELNYGWSDGKHFSFSRWSENSAQLEDCVILDTDGFWKAAGCKGIQAGAICYTSGNESEKELKKVNTVKCPSPILNTPWIPFQNSCYNFMIAKNRFLALTNDEIQLKCQTLYPKAHVLSIRNERENDFVREQLLYFNYMASWVLLGVIYDDGSLKWSDKTALSYTNWKTGRQTIKTKEFFAGLNTEGFWDIYSYDTVGEALYFHQRSILACKIEMVDYKEEYNRTLPQLIPYEDSIYNVVQKKVTWYEALKECSQNEGSLASVHDKNGQFFLEDLAKRDGFPLWTGLSSHDGNNSIFEWSDGSTFDYSPWKEQNSTGNCVVLHPNGIWKYEKCSSVMDGAICYIPKKAKQQPSQKSSSRCPSHKGTPWIPFGDSCYTFDKALYNFSEAKQLCPELDSAATIVTIKNEDENMFVSRMIREHNYVTMRVWLGLSQHSNDESWSWLDNSVVEYVKWGNESKNIGKCSILLASSEMWTKVKCDQGYGRVVCKVPMDCPSSTWVQFQSNCYIFLETSIKIGNIEDVRNQCTDYASGADMISIHNEEENAFILETFKKRWKSQDDILLGMFYDTDDESFKWYDKSNMTFNKWKNSEDSPNLIDTCAFFQTKSGIWKKGNCEVSSVEGALCKAAVSYEKKYLPDNHILITALVIASTTILTITGAIVWFLYKRNLTSGLTNTSYTTAPQLSYNDDCILVDAEENEYIA